VTFLFFSYFIHLIFSTICSHKLFNPPGHGHSNIRACTGSPGYLFSSLNLLCVIRSNHEHDDCVPSVLSWYITIPDCSQASRLLASALLHSLPCDAQIAKCSHKTHNLSRTKAQPQCMKHKRVAYPKLWLQHPLNE